MPHTAFGGLTTPSSGCVLCLRRVPPRNAPSVPRVRWPVALMQLVCRVQLPLPDRWPSSASRARTGSRADNIRYYASGQRHRNGAPGAPGRRRAALCWAIALGTLPLEARPRWSCSPAAAHVLVPPAPRSTSASRWSSATSSQPAATVAPRSIGTRWAGASRPGGPRESTLGVRPLSWWPRPPCWGLGLAEGLVRLFAPQSPAPRRGTTSLSPGSASRAPASAGATSSRALRRDGVHQPAGALARGANTQRARPRTRRASRYWETASHSAGGPRTTRRIPRASSVFWPKEWHPGASR